MKSNGNGALTLRESRLFAVRLAEEGGPGEDRFFVEAFDIVDAARRAAAVARYQSVSERGGVSWEVASLEPAGIVRRLFAELR